MDEDTHQPLRTSIARHDILRYVRRQVVPIGHARQLIAVDEPRDRDAAQLPRNAGRCFRPRRLGRHSRRSPTASRATPDILQAMASAATWLSWPEGRAIGLECGYVFVPIGEGQPRSVVLPDIGVNPSIREWASWTPRKAAGFVVGTSPNEQFRTAYLLRCERSSGRVVASAWIAVHGNWRPRQRENQRGSGGAVNALRNGRARGSRGWAQQRPEEGRGPRLAGCCWKLHAHMRVATPPIIVAPRADAGQAGRISLATCFLTQRALVSFARSAWRQAATCRWKRTRSGA